MSSGQAGRLPGKQELDEVSTVPTMVLSLAGPAVRFYLLACRDERSVSYRQVFDSQTHRGLMYKPEANLLRNSEADPLLELTCSLLSHPCLECCFPRHLGNHLKNLKVASQRAWTQQKRQDALGGPFNAAKVSLFP